MVNIVVVGDLSKRALFVRGLKSCKTLQESNTMQILLLALGLVLLFGGGELLLRGSVALASNMRVSKLFISIFIIGFGTSLPELVASANSALKGAPSIALGNVIGSNIANILIIIGLAAALYRIKASAEAVHRDVFCMLGATALFIALCALNYLNIYSGGLLIACMTAYLGWSFLEDRRQRRSADDSDPEESTPSAPIALLLIVIGLGALLGGADMLVEAAITLARAYGVSELIIGLSLIALGTSLPEVVMAVVASLKKQSEMVIGNIVGSNIFNLLFILGVTAILKPIPVSPRVLTTDLWILLAATLLLAVLLLQRANIGRPLGLLMLGAYCLYIGSLALL